MCHPIRGLLIGPLVAPFAYWIGVMAWVGLVEARFDSFRALRELKLILVFGLPVAYAAALAWVLLLSTCFTGSAGCGRLPSCWPARSAGSALPRCSCSASKAA